MVGEFGVEDVVVVAEEEGGVAGGGEDQVPQVGDVWNGVTRRRDDGEDGTCRETDVVAAVEDEVEFIVGGGDERVAVHVKVDVQQFSGFKCGRLQHRSPRLVVSGR